MSVDLHIESHLGCKVSDKKIISKIEGEAKLKIYGDKKIEFVEIEFWQYRGIEEYLKNRHFLDALVINPRICGICGHSHLLATVLAIESAIDAKITQKAKILREITTLLEIVENHIKWFYITLVPCVIKDKKYIFKAVKFSSKISKAIALVAGQYPHNSYMIPGGVTCDLTNLEIFKLKELIKQIYDEYIKEIMNEDLISKDLALFFENVPKDIGKGVNKFLVLGNQAFFKSNGNLQGVSEEKSTSLSKNALYNNEFYEVGPLARGILNNEKIKKIYEKYQDSIYTRVVARVYEPLVILSYLLEKIDEIDMCERSFLKPKIKNAKATIAIEAPRGSLIHSIEIEDEKIKNYNIIVPTQFNLSSSTKEKPSPAQASLIGEDKKYAEVLFKCFDICAVCMTH